MRRRRLALTGTAAVLAAVLGGCTAGSGTSDGTTDGSSAAAAAGSADTAAVVQDTSDALTWDASDETTIALTGGTATVTGTGASVDG